MTKSVNPAEHFLFSGVKNEGRKTHKQVATEDNCSKSDNEGVASKNQK